MDLPFLPDSGKSLLEGEQARVLQWYNTLNAQISEEEQLSPSLRKVWKNREWVRRTRNEDQQGMKDFLSGCYKWLKDMPDRFYVMNAVGSSLATRCYKDLDFLLLTNAPLEMFKIGNVSEQGLNTYLAGHRAGHAVTDSLELYESEMLNFPNRDLWCVIPKGGLSSPARKIHLILQPGIESENVWARYDRFERLPLFRILSDSKSMPEME